MTQKQNRLTKILMAVLMVAGLLLLAKMAAQMNEQRRPAAVISDNTVSGQDDMQNGSGNMISGGGGAERQPGQDCIVIDPGHGGVDPGKVGVNGALEKDINLQMAYLLKESLEAQGFYVVLTRTGDESLSGDGSNSGKVQDLQNRIRLITEEDPILVISIHQNSYTQESARGAQVFYYETSEDAKLLAECIQRSLIAAVDDGNHREPKGNTSYFLLKKTPVVTVIVECGFLSNWQEAELLVQESYQRIMVGAITDGILEFLEINR